MKPRCAERTYPALLRHGRSQSFRDNEPTRTVRERRLRSRTERAFPFGFGGESSVDPRRIQPRLPPTDVCHRMVQSPFDRFAFVPRVEPLIFLVRDGCGPNLLGVRSARDKDKRLRPPLPDGNEGSANRLALTGSRHLLCPIGCHNARLP
jgi:hypothetical protein